MQLLADPTPVEHQHFAHWEANHIQTILHTDTALSDRYGITNPSEFDFFRGKADWAYNAFLNQLCGIESSERYSLSFNLADWIDPEKVIHIQEHHTPLYTVEAFRYRDQVVAHNGDNNTYHAGAYLSDGLHEGAVVSAMRVAQLIGFESASHPLGLDSSERDWPVDKPVVKPLVTASRQTVS